MSLTKRLLDELNKEEEPRYDNEVETWPSEGELSNDSENEQ